jgi:hypothetical protein
MTTTNAQPPYRITNVHNITLNGEPRVCFTAHIKDGDAYVHIGQFSAPADTPEDALFEHINLNDEQNEEQS